MGGCHERLQESPRFDKFDNLFDSVADTSLSEMDFKVLKRKGDEEPYTMVFKKESDLVYKLTARFNDRPFLDRDVHFSIKISEEKH